MAGYYTSFNGDILKINYVDPVFEAKSILIPGLTTPMDVVVNAESAYYFDIDGLEAKDGDAGRTLELADSGAKKVTVDLKKSIAFFIVLKASFFISVVEPFLSRLTSDNTPKLK